MTMTTETDISHRELRKNLQGKMHSRKASLTDVEEAFLHALLIDPPATTKGDKDVGESSTDEEERSEQLKQATKVLDDDMLFSVPECLAEEDKPVRRPSVVKKPRDYRFLVGLWQAHEDGVSPKKLTKLSGRKSIGSSINVGELFGKPEAETEPDDEDEDDEIDAESAKSDQEVRGESSNDDSSADSWDEKDGGFHHFDAWEVLKDEYAADFGFDFTPDGAAPSMDDTELEANRFKILGTSADDKSAHPHVLSPPLIDALLFFVPDHIQGQNMWMKYSLVRDGASLDTFKQYSRASKDTILAIETTKGDVFGCYTSNSWRTNPSFYGGAPSFVWKMRHGRNTPCHSLIEQAQMESEIDVYFYLGNEHRVQCCKSDIIGIGEGNLAKYDIYGRLIEDDELSDENSKNFGFAIALQDDLLSGTTSKCSSYKNPCFVDPDANGEPFEVLNVELWTFTPCFTLDSAEKLEMTQFFVSESMRNTSINSSSGRSETFSGRDLTQNEFYRRVGHGDNHEELRERWQYRGMMDGTLQTNRGIGATPRFNNTQQK